MGDKIYADISESVTLWDLPDGISLTFSEDSLVDAGFPEDKLNLKDLKRIFNCSVTIETNKLESIHA